MRKRQTLAIDSGSKVWVWHSIWLPALVGTSVNLVKVRVSDRISFNVGVEVDHPRSPVRGNDTPGSRWLAEGMSHKNLKVAILDTKTSCTES